MHAEKNDKLGIRLTRVTRELERIAGVIGMTIDAFLLVMVAEYHQALAEPGLGRNDAFLQLVCLGSLKTLEFDGCCLHISSIFKSVWPRIHANKRRSMSY